MDSAHFLVSLVRDSNECVHRTHNPVLAAWGRAEGTSARPGEGGGGQEVWLEPDTPSGTPAVAAEMVLPAASTSVALSGSEKDS